MDAGCDDTRARRKQFGVFLCLPMALVLLLICNGDFGMSPIYGHHGARRYLPVSVHVGRRTLTAMGVEKLICPMSALGQKQTCAAQKVMSALPPKADIGFRSHLGFQADPGDSTFKSR